MDGRKKTPGAPRLWRQWCVLKGILIPVVTLALAGGDIRARPQGYPAGADVGELSRICCLENSQQFNRFRVWVLCLVQGNLDVQFELLGL